MRLSEGGVIKNDSRDYSCTAITVLDEHVAELCGTEGEIEGGIDDRVSTLRLQRLRQPQY
jgi:hypothetical protein